MMVPGLEIVQLETPVHCIECGRAGHGFWSLGWNSVFASEELGDLGLLTAPPASASSSAVCLGAP